MPSMRERGIKKKTRKEVQGWHAKKYTNKEGRIYSKSENKYSKPHPNFEILGPQMILVLFQARKQHCQSWFNFIHNLYIGNLKFLGW